MRTRTAKKLAQRIDLNYFKHSRGMRRWRGLLSLAIPAAALLWLGVLAAAGNRTVYSSGAVSDAHAFIEAKCEVCHTREASFRSHVTEQACLTCHDAPAHPPGGPAGPVLAGLTSGASGRAGMATAAVQHPGSPQGTPDCATCHREHKGRVQLALTPDKFCVDCHGDLAPAVGEFPDRHAEFAVLRDGQTDPGNLRFNHAVHNSPTLRGPGGPEPLECTACHKPEMSRAGSPQKMSGGLMASIDYEQQCARCHTLFFDERIDAEAPHDTLPVVRPFVEKALAEFIAANPGAIAEPDVPGRRVPLNFPRATESPARTPQEWVLRRTARAERLLTERTCAYCHGPASPAAAGATEGPRFQPTNLPSQWMPRAQFDHAPHLMVECASCHTGAETSRATADVLMPSVATCATCHAPSRGASSQCVECHGYHDWTKAQPVKPHFKLTDFQ